MVYYDDKLISKSIIDRYYKLNLREGNRQAFIDRSLVDYTDHTSRLKKNKIQNTNIMGTK